MARKKSNSKRGILRTLLFEVNYLFKNRGFRQTILVIFSRCYDYFFDWKFKTNTFHFVELNDMGISEAMQQHAVMYQPSSTLALRDIFSTLALPASKIFVDFGCGKGKVLMIASEFAFNKLRGIDFSMELCEIARLNCSIYKKATMTNSNFEVVRSDVSEYSIKDDEDVFYFFNPFDEIVLLVVLQNILKSLQNRTRKIWIIYRNAIHKKIVAEKMNPTSISEYNFWGFDFVVFEIGSDASDFQTASI